MESCFTLSTSSDFSIFTLSSFIFNITDYLHHHCPQYMASAGGTRHMSLCSVCWHWRGQVAMLIYHAFFSDAWNQRDRVYCSSTHFVKMSKLLQVQKVFSVVIRLCINVHHLVKKPHKNNFDIFKNQLEKFIK